MPTASLKQLAKACIIVMISTNSAIIFFTIVWARTNKVIEAAIGDRKTVLIPTRREIFRDNQKNIIGHTFEDGGSRARGKHSGGCLVCFEEAIPYWWLKRYEMQWAQKEYRRGFVLRSADENPQIRRVWNERTVVKLSLKVLLKKFVVVNACTGRMLGDGGCNCRSNARYDGIRSW